MICDIGGGTTEVAVISLGGLVQCQSVRIAGDECDEAVIAHLRREYNLLIGEQSAERIKVAIGSAYPLRKEMSMEVKGRDLAKGLPRKVVVTSEEVRAALAEPVLAIVAAVKATLEATPPELSADLVDLGIVMAGGGSLIRGVDRVIAEETGLPVRVAKEPRLLPLHAGRSRGVGIRFVDVPTTVRRRSADGGAEAAPSPRCRSMLAAAEE
jgi:rod shape-determining protein MreB